MADKKSRVWWQPQIAAFEVSGQKLSEFPELNGLSLVSLRNWLHKIRLARRQAALPALVQAQWQ